MPRNWPRPYFTEIHATLKDKSMIHRLCLITLLTVCCAWSQVQTIPNVPFPSVRALMNSNFSWLNDNKLQLISGNLGIGTTSPAQLLHLESSSAWPVIRLRKAGTGYYELGAL